MGPEPSPGFFNLNNLFCHMSNTFTFFIIQPGCLRLLHVSGRVVSDQVLENQPDLIKNTKINIKVFILNDSKHKHIQNAIK